MKSRLIFYWALSYLLIMTSCSSDEQSIDETPTIEPSTNTFIFPKSETFTFSSNGIDLKGKIYLPDSYEPNSNYPAVYLLDYKEQHFTVAKDEAEQVIKGVQKITGLDALVVTLNTHNNIDSKPDEFRDHYEVFKNMTLYVDANYTTSTSRTFIARGSEAGIVLLALLSEDQTSSVFNNFIATDSPLIFNNAVRDLINSNNVPEDLVNKKLHFSYSSSNDRNDCLDLIETFEGAKYPWLKFVSREYTTDYTTTYPIAFADGLKFVFAN